MQGLVPPMISFYIEVGYLHMNWCYSSSEVSISQVRKFYDRYNDVAWVECCLMCFITYVKLFWHSDFDYGLLRLPDLEIRLTTCVTGREGMLTPPTHFWFVKRSMFAQSFGFVFQTIDGSRFCFKGVGWWWWGFWSWKRCYIFCSVLLEMFGIWCVNGFACPIPVNGCIIPTFTWKGNITRRVQSCTWYIVYTDTFAEHTHGECFVAHRRFLKICSNMM
jgi:hypothetical protein